MRPIDSWQVLRHAAAFGPYFAVEHATDVSGWFRLTALTDTDDTLLRERVGFVRAALAAMAGRDASDVEQRAAASTHALALCSRLVAPALGTAVTDAAVVPLTPHDVLWQPVVSGPVPLGMIEPSAHHGDSTAELATLIHDTVVATAVQPLVEAFARTFALSPRVLWGNVSSALAGAAVMIRSGSAADGRTAVDVVSSLISQPLLAGSGQYEHGRFMRTSCCLFYRVPGGGLCGDCVLNHGPRRHRPGQPSTSSSLG